MTAGSNTLATPRLQFNTVDWVLSVLSIIIIVFYIRGLFKSDTIVVNGSHRYCEFFEEFGLFGIDVLTSSPPLNAPHAFEYYKNEETDINWSHLMSDTLPGVFSGTIDKDVRLLGFRFSKLHDFTWSALYLQIPSWFLLALFVPRPTLRIIRSLRKANTVEPGPFCRKCGYDLRATVGRCPECGTSTPLCRET